MSLTDILFDLGDKQEYILEFELGSLNSPNDVVFEDSILEIGPTYPDPEVIAAAIWAYETRTLT